MRLKSLPFWHSQLKFLTFPRFRYFAWPSGTIQVVFRWQSSTVRWSQTTSPSSSTTPARTSRQAASWATRCHFHQRSTNSFYVRRSQKHKNDSKVVSLFALSGSACAKAESKMLLKLSQGRVHEQLWLRWLPQGQSELPLHVASCRCWLQQQFKKLAQFTNEQLFPAFAKLSILLVIYKTRPKWW